MVKKYNETAETLAGSRNGINDFRGHLIKNTKHYPAYSIAADESTDVNTLRTGDADLRF